MTDIVQGQVASRIFEKTAPTWLKRTSAKRTSEYVDQTATTTYISDEGGSPSTSKFSGNSSPVPRTNTGETSSCESQAAETKKPKELTKALAD